MTDNRQLPAVSTRAKQLPMSITDAQTVGELFMKAGLFDVSVKENEKAGMTPDKKAAINAVKVLAGQELGLGPFAAMKGLHVVSGKVTPGYQTMLALLRKTPGYDYEILENSKERARMQVYRNGKPLGPEYKFDTSDMQTAHLGGTNWTNYPAQMRLSKCVSQCINAVCPEILGGTTYTPEDFDQVAEVDPDIVEAEVQSSPKQQIKSSVNSAVSPATSAATSKTATEIQKTASATEKKSSKESAETAASNTGQPASTAATSEKQKESSEPIDVEIQTVTNLDDEFSQAAGMTVSAVCGTLLETGSINGWNEQTIEEWLIGYLDSQGVPCDSIDNIQANWTMAQINYAMDYVVANKPPVLEG